MKYSFWIYLLVMAGITYLIRMLPLVLVKKKVKNKFLISFLYYVPYAVLSVMTIPAIFYSTESIISALAGFIAACILAYFEKSLISVAATASIVVFITDYLIKII